MKIISARGAVAIALTLAGVVAAGPTVSVAGGMPGGGRGAPPAVHGGFPSPGNPGFSFNPGAPFSFNPSAPFSFNPPARPNPRRQFRRQRGFYGYGGGGVYAVPYVSEPAYSEQPSYDVPLAAGPSPSYTQVVVYTPPAPATYPPAVTTVPPAAPARPSVVEFQEGRYELRGDGVNAPYAWVWIPNPPTAPPAPPAPGAAAPRDTSPARRSQLYRWLDDDGVVHLTDRIESVPEEYRPQVKRHGPS